MNMNAILRSAAVVFLTLVPVRGVPLPASLGDAPWLPSRALHEVFDQMRSQPTKQGEIAKQVLSRTQTAGLSRDEAFALAELYFAALMPKQSTEAYSAFTSGNDQHARTALQRVIFMKMVAFQQFDGITDDLVAYRKRFQPSSDDIFGLAEPIGVLAAHFRSEGRHDDVVKLVVEELAALPLDAPYMSFSLVASNLESFQRTGKQDDAVRLLKAATRAYAHVADTKVSVPTGPIEHRPGIIHRVEQQLRLDYAPAPSQDDSIVDAKAKVKSALSTLSRTGPAGGWSDE